MATSKRAGGASKPLVDDATLHQWTETGARHIRSKLAHALKEAADAKSDAIIDPESDLYRLLYELIWVVVHAKLTRHDIVSVLKEAELTSFPDACDTFLDLLWIIGNEIETNEKGRERHSSPEWQHLCRFVKAIAEEELVPVFSLKSSLEFDLLHDAGLMSEPQVIRKKILRINTKSLYTQMKYNLLREESEGFAKVLSLLHTGVTQDQLEASKTDLLALIGYFDLDANRVLDLVLDAYEMHPQNHCFAELLGAFKRDSIPHVIGFKFQFYKRENATSGIVTPRSLYRLAATLIAKNLLAMDALLPHLAPSKEEIVKLHMVRVKKLEEEARSFGKVNLGGSKGDDKMDGEKARAETSGADDHNQVFGLIVGMLEIGSEKQAFEMIQWFQERGVNPLAYKPLSAQLCASVHSLVELLYEPLSLKKMQLVVTSNSSSSATKKKEIANKASDDDDKKPKTLVTPLTTQDELVAVVFPILEMLGAQLHHDELLFTKLLRIIDHLLESEAKKKATATTAITIEEEFEGSLMAKVKDLIVKSFLPAITYQSSNPSSVFQLWDLIKLYPFDQRYRMYQQWQAAYASSPEMKLVEAQVVQNTRKVMRRLTADRAKPSARSLTHFAHSNPLIVFRTMLHQIQSYDNLIQPVVESFKFITPLGMDVLSFVLVSELAKSRQSMKSDGTNISLWLASLASFSGSFYRKYPNVELAGLLQYLIQRLQNWESVDLIVLSELLSKMGSCISFEDISLSQLEAQAGGPHLWHEPADPKLMNRRAIPRLRDALVKRNLALPLCLLICQMRSRIEYQESSPLTHLKLLGRVYDTCQMTLSQLLQFLNGVVDPLVYTKMLPSVSALVQDYHIQAELAMTLCRPAIRFDDPVLRKAPRSIHATGTSSSSAAESGAETRRNWFMNAPELIDDISSAIKSSVAGSDPFVGMTKDLYVMFWSLILYDIHVPFPQYEFEILRLRNSLSTAGNSGGANGGPLTASERKKLKEKTSQMIDKLTNEQKDQVAHRKRVYERLEEKKKVFFAREAADSRTAVQELLQKCVIPRALLSPEDALFCAKFMERVHYINTPEFSTLQYYNTINLKLPSMVLCVTEREAGNFGIFLKETVTLLYRWYQSGATYEEDALHGKSGFSVDLNDPKKKLPHRQYKLVYAKWHKWMAKVFSTTLASEEYMPMRNTLIILTKLIDVFPASKSTAESMLEIVEVLTKEDREDIKIMAKRYFALLTKRKSSLVEDKLLAVTVAKKPAAIKEAKDTAVDEPLDDMDGVEAAVATPVESEEPVATTSSSSNSGANAGAESSRERRVPPIRVLRQDLESGEISTPPPSTQSNSSRRSSERPPVSNDSAKGGDNANSSRSSNQQRLKRRDSDRGIATAGGTPEENSSHNNSSRRGDEKRGRREIREGRDAREASPGKPPVGPSSSSNNSRSGNAAGAPADVPVVSGHKRDRSRERRSRSPEGRGRGNGRDRGERGGVSERDGSSSRGERDAPKDSSIGNNSNSEQLSSGESRKRQRVDPSAAEAALRRQLTEKKGQDQHRDSRDRQDGSQSKSESASRGSGGNGDGVPPRSGGEGAPTRGEVDRSERQQQPPPASAGTTRKIVSLVSSSRKREQPSQDEDDHRSSAQVQPAPVAGEEGDRLNDERRRRDSGRGGGGHGRREGGGGGDGGGEQKRGSQDEKKKSRGHGRKNNGDGGGGQPQQQRDQGNRVGGGNERRGGSGGGQARGGDGGGRGNDDRGNQANNGGGGNGGGGRRRDERRGGGRR